MMYTTESCRIRPATPEDATVLATWWADGKIMEHAGFPKGLNTNHVALKERLLVQSKMDTLWLIEQHDGHPIGEMHHRIKNAQAQIGIKLCVASTQGQGIGPDALKWLICYLFTQFDITEIVLDTMIENTRAQKVYERLHFQKVNLLKECWQDQLGRMRTAIVYRLSRHDFLQHASTYCQS
ncbi:MAG: N-acetyltransferase [Acholeplasmatales bacterium]|nr:MAG: N-acetyltransferase [Acholeplasmatales bacterium]